MAIMYMHDKNLIKHQLENVKFCQILSQFVQEWVRDEG